MEPELGNETIVCMTALTIGYQESLNGMKASII